MKVLGSRPRRLVPEDDPNVVRKDDTKSPPRPKTTPARSHSVVIIGFHTGGHMSVQGSTGYVVETSVLTKRFGDRVAVDSVELRVPQGSAFGYLGPNGAGKTTL